MDILNLQTFVAVADTGSFSRAAEQLHLTQPAVSKRIAALETEVDLRVFDRIGRRVSLTEAGRALLPRARRILLEVEDSRRALSRINRHVVGPLRAGTSHHIGLHRLPPVLREYTRRHPGVHLDMHFMDSEQACQSVERGDLELGIVTLPLDPPPPLEVRPVWDDPLCVTVASEHSLAADAPLDPRELASHPAILPDRGTFTRRVIDAAFEPFGVEPRARLSTNYLETIRMLVSIGLGWSVLPVTMLGDDLVPLETPGLGMHRQLGLVVHRGRSLSRAGEEMIRLLEEASETPAR